MPFGLGSKSAQTPSESSQGSESNVRGAIAQVLAGITAADQYRVIHKWRKVGSTATRGMPHHCQLFIYNTIGREVANFGLFSGKNDKVLFENDGHMPDNPYIRSTSYKPNPIVKTGQEIIDAYTAASLKCGPDYKLLQNNCQKFARLFMTELGASHSRELFHP